MLNPSFWLVKSPCWLLNHPHFQLGTTRCSRASAPISCCAASWTSRLRTSSSTAYWRPWGLRCLPPSRTIFDGGYGCGSKWKTDVGPQMEMSSLVLTIHNFGVPNFDPYPYGGKNSRCKKGHAKTFFVCAVQWIKDSKIIWGKFMKMENSERPSTFRRVNSLSHLAC